MASWGGFKNKVYSMIVSGAVMGVGTVALGLIPIFWIYCLIMALVGFAMPMLNTPATVLLQQKVEEEYLGRVFGVLSMISSSMMPLGMLVFGPLADRIRIEWMLVATGILMIFTIAALFGNRTLVEIGRT